MHHFRPVAGHLQHFFIAHLSQKSGLRNQARIGAVNAFNVSVYLANRGAEAGGEGDGGGVRATPAQGGGVHIGGNALEAGDDDHTAFFQLFDHPVGIYLEDAGAAESGVSADAGLGAAEADGGTAHGVQRHGEEGGGDHLPGGEEHVEFAVGRFLGNLVSQGNQLVGGVTHCRNDDDDLIAGVPRTDDAPRHVFYLLGISDRGAAVFLNDDGHYFIDFPSSLPIILYPSARKRPVFFASASVNLRAPLAAKPGPQRRKGTGSSVWVWT